VVEINVGGGWVDAVHNLTFAFVFHAFVLDGEIHKKQTGIGVELSSAPGRHILVKDATT